MGIDAMVSAYNLNNFISIKSLFMNHLLDGIRIIWMEGMQIRIGLANPIGIYVNGEENESGCCPTLINLMSCI